MVMLRMSALFGLILLLLSTALAGAAVAAGNTLPRSELTYVGFEDTEADVFVYDTQRGRRHNLTSSPGYDLSPAWSPNGEQLAFVSDRDGGLQVFIVDATGRNLRRLTPEGRAFEFPRWSADGERLYVMARTSTTPDVFAVSPNGGPLELISSQSANPFGTVMDLGIEMYVPGSALSPSGYGYLRVDFTGRERRLLLSPSEAEPGEVLASLGPLAADNMRASWSNDGQQIAFLSAQDSTVDLYLIAAQPRASPLRLTHDRAYERDLVWRP